MLHRLLTPCPLSPAAVQKRMGLNDKEEQERRAFLTQLLKIMNTQLRDTILALSEILSGRTKWNSNFEIFELSIRRLPPSHTHARAWTVRLTSR